MKDLQFHASNVAAIYGNIASQVASIERTIALLENGQNEMQQ